MEELSYGQINNIDVLVIGAGPIGLVTALWFAKRGYKIVLIEQYSENKSYTQGRNSVVSLNEVPMSLRKKAFNERHQQVGLNPNSLKFLKDLDIVIWGEINKMGSEDGNWVNIPIYLLQNILHREIKNYENVHVLFNTIIDSVTCIDPKLNCRISMTMNNERIYGIYPR